MALYTSLVVREDAQQLFGFATFEERQVFEVLLTISKVGARTAPSFPVPARRPAPHRAGRGRGCPHPGERHRQEDGPACFLELKYKLKVEDVPQAAVLAPNGRPGSVFRDVLDGLSILAILKTNALLWSKNILLQEPDLDVTGALRAALKALARGRL